MKKPIIFCLFKDLKLVIQLSIAFGSLLTLLLFSFFVLRKFSRIREKGYFSISSHYYCKLILFTLKKFKQKYF